MADRRKLESIVKKLSRFSRDKAKVQMVDPVASLGDLGAPSAMDLVRVRDRV